MSEPRELDYYEILQVSPRADQETLERVFRHLAKRYHPDHEGGDASLFSELVEAYRVLSDPEKRADYDARYASIRENSWKIFDQESAGDNIEEDRRIRQALLAALYTARRNDADQPGMGALELERLLGCPQEHLKFHLWYIRENGWVERLPNGLIAITAAGVDRAMEMGVRGPGASRRLPAGEPLQQDAVSDE
jgi:curved DNA-binding protein CbpA